MHTSVACPNAGCGKPCKVREEQVGRRLRCPHCRAVFIVTSLGTGDAQTVATSFADWQPRALPKQIGRFQILEWLGAGGFGTVYRAFDPQMQRDVALKVPLEALRQEPKTIERLLREARSAGVLRHAHIVPVYEVGGNQSQPYIASAYVEGRTLEEIISNSGPLPVRQAVEIVRDLADALAYAHEKGIVHRDVKSSNVILDGRGTAHLMDFGLACHEGQADSFTSEGDLAGTPAYVAPEQITDSGNRNFAAGDQYSLGVVLYELLTGQLPFEGPAAVVLHNVVHGETIPPRQLRPEIPGDLEAICLRAMARDPKERYPGCAELAQGLRNWLDSHSRPRSRGVALRSVLAVLVVVLIAIVVTVALAPYFGGRPPKKDSGRGIEADEKPEPPPIIALDFDGIDDFVDIPSLRYDGTHPLTIEAWVRLSESRQGVIMTNGHMLLGILDGYWFAGAQDLPGEGGEAWRYFWSADPCEPGRFTHIAIVFTESEGRMYVDGRRQRVQAAFRAKHIPSPQGFTLGTFKTATGERLSSFRGQIAGVRIFKTARYLDDFKPPVRPEVDLDTVARYPFDSRERDVLLDVSGNRHDGKIVGATRVAVPGKELQADILGAFDPSRKLGWRQQVAAVLNPAEWPFTVKGGGTWTDDGVSVQCVALDHKGQFLATGDGKGAVVLWSRAADGWKREKGISDHKGPIHALAFATSNDLLASGGEDRTLRLWRRVDSRWGAGPVLVHRDGISGAVFAPDGSRLYTTACVWDDPKSGELRAWDPAAGKELPGFAAGETKQLTCLALTLDGSTLATGGQDSTVRLWDARTGKSLQTLEGNGRFVHGVAFSADGLYLASVGGDGVVKVWAKKEASWKHLKDLPHQKAASFAVLFAGKHNVIVVSAEKAIQLFDLERGVLLASLRGHYERGTALSFTLDTSLLISTSMDGTFRQWDFRWK